MIRCYVIRLLFVPQGSKPTQSFWVRTHIHLIFMHICLFVWLDACFIASMCFSKCCVSVGIFSLHKQLNSAPYLDRKTLDQNKKTVKLRRPVKYINLWILLKLKCLFGLLEQMDIENIEKMTAVFTTTFIKWVCVENFSISLSPSITTSS